MFFYHIQYCDDYLWRGFRYLHPDAACAGMSNDLGRLDDLNQLSRYICEYRPKPEEIQKGLEKIRDKQGYSFKTQILIYAVISGSFSVFLEEMSTI